MRENRTYGSEGGESRVFSTPIVDKKSPRSGSTSKFCPLCGVCNSLDSRSSLPSNVVIGGRKIGAEGQFAINLKNVVEGQNYLFS